MGREEHLQRYLKKLKCMFIKEVENLGYRL